MYEIDDNLKNKYVVNVLNENKMRMQGGAFASK
jgi:hypothetical protein